jgi:hypothetical protein
MAVSSAPRAEVAFHYDDNDTRTVLLTVIGGGIASLGPRLEELGMSVGGLSAVLIATAGLHANPDGSYSDLDGACRHASLADARSHAIDRLGGLLREYGIQPCLV